MGKRRDVFYGLIGLFVFAVGAWLAWQLLWFIGGVARDLDSQQLGIVVPGSVTLLVAVITVVFTNRGNKLREIAESHRPRKVEIYLGFMDMMVRILKSTKTGEAINIESNPELMEEWFDFKKGMIVWASPDVIKAYTEFENQSQTKSKKGIQILDDVLREMRQDLGNSNWGLPSGSLVGMFLTPEARTEVKDGGRTTT